MYDISNMPKVIQAITHVVPARYFVSLLKGIYLKGIGLEVLMMEAVLLTVFGLLVFLTANLDFKKKMA
jgi:ABC-2 type transport system permease protein